MLGFEIPVASSDREPVARMAVVYVAANEKRLLRFYRSRGHRVVDTTGGWRLQHSDRTLAGHPEEAREQLGKALVHVTQGPGPGWTLRFDDGAPIAPEPPPLMQLVTGVGGGDGTPGAATPATHGAATDAADPGLFQDADSQAGAAEAAQRRKLRRATARRLDPSEIARLRKAALGRKYDKSRARDVSERILNYVEQNPGKGFRD